MSDSTLSSDASQPLLAEATQVAGAVQTTPGPALCANCKVPIEEQYFEVKGHVICSTCKTALEGRYMKGTAGGGMWRSTLYGIGAAIAGAVLYYAIREATGLEIGLIAIAVGWMVGRAVQKGGSGVGGRKYQVLAVGLTYLAITATYMPYVVKGIETGISKRAAADSVAAKASDSTGSAPSVAAPAAISAAADTGSPSASGQNKQPTSALGFAGAVLMLLGTVVALPVIANLSDMPGGIIGLAILFFGLSQAWRMNKGLAFAFNGPFKLGVRSGAVS